MNPQEYEVELLYESVRYRVRYETHKGQVIGFVVQLEFKTTLGWRPVVRYDTAHGFAHRDSLSVRWHSQPA
jgi:hypothetical protein